MEPIELARATAPCVRDFTAAFMVDPATYQRGAELGYPGADFYFVGRGGVLGDTSGAVVAAAFVFFEASVVTAAWERGAGVAPRADAAAEFAASGHAWARNHLVGDDVVSAAGVVAALGAKVVAAAQDAGAPLFAGWRALEVPTDEVAAAHHTLNALRELRGAYHGGAVLGAGLTPRQAVLLADPHMAPIHGYQPEPAVDEALRDRLAAAGEATDRAMAVPYAALAPDEADRFADACAVLHARL